VECDEGAAIGYLLTTITAVDPDENAHLSYTISPDSQEFTVSDRGIYYILLYLYTIYYSISILIYYSISILYTTLSLYYILLYLYTIYYSISILYYTTLSLYYILLYLYTIYYVFTGEVRVNKPLDRETTPVYHVTLSASDSTYSSSTELIVSLLDINDEMPVFSRAQYSLSVSEKATPGVTVGSVKAVDDDLGVGGEVKYRILSTWGSDLFSINSQTGLITLEGSLDFEEVSVGMSFYCRGECGRVSLLQR